MPLEREGGQAQFIVHDQPPTTRGSDLEPLLTTHAVDRIAAQVGFGSPTAFRDRFKHVVGTSPHALPARIPGIHRQLSGRAQRGDRRVGHGGPTLK
jgi:AraC-like DNA-binding protein